MKLKQKSTKWLEKQIEKMKIELNYRNRVKYKPFPQLLPIEKRDSSGLGFEVTYFVNCIWNGNPTAFTEDSFRKIFIEALKMYYGPDIWEKIQIKVEL